MRRKRTTSGWAMRKTSRDPRRGFVVRPCTCVVLMAAVVISIAGPVAAQTSPGPVVDADWLARNMGDAQLLLLHADMRRAPYDEGHIPGARFLDLNRFVWDGDPAWGTEMRSSEEVGGALRTLGLNDGVEHVVVYGSNPLFASRAFMTMEVMGLEGRVHVLDGGQTGWIDSGRELSTQEPVSAGGGTLTLALRMTCSSRPTGSTSDWRMTRSLSWTLGPTMNTQVPTGAWAAWPTPDMSRARIRCTGKS